MRLSHEAVNEQRAERFSRNGGIGPFALLGTTPDLDVVQSTRVRPKHAFCNKPTNAPSSNSNAFYGVALLLSRNGHDRWQ